MEHTEVNKNSMEHIHQINYLTAELNSLYHHAALIFGFSDSVMQVLYYLRDHGHCCLLKDIYKQCGTSKQTIHSAIRKLEKEGTLYLEAGTGKNKMVYLTEKGKRLVEQTIDHVFQAEANVFASWPEEEVESYLNYMERFIRHFEKQVVTLQEIAGCHENDACHRL